MKELIVGLQYGDEGKGRVSAFYGKDADWFVRFNGGPNAGHTVYHEGVKHALHHLPAGAVMGKKVALDAGMVIDPKGLVEECKKANVDPDNLYMSAQAHIIQPKHVEQDSNGSGIGTTRKGIAYAYADKALRKGKRVIDSIRFDSSRYPAFFDRRLNTKNIYLGLPPIKSGEHAIYESAQGIMLDIDYGYYPFVTSSSVFPGANHKIDKIIGVMKAYTSRVGNGPPDYNEVEGLADAGDEFGTTTGRKRRCTWLILDEIKRAIAIAQLDEIVVTKLDILKDMDIKVWLGGGTKYIKIGSLDSYKDFLLTHFPQIKYFSESPDGDLIRVNQ